MANDIGNNKDYEAKGTTYQIPIDSELADGPKAFAEFADSIPFSEYVSIVEVSSDTTVDDSFNGKMIVATENVTLTFGTLTAGFSVAAVAEADKTIEYVGVDKVDEMTTAYEVATVVSVGGTNILNVARGGDIIIDGGVAEGTPPAPTAPNGDAELVGESVIPFISGGDGAAGPTLAYGASIEPQDGATVEVDQDNLEVSVLGTTPFVDYVVTIYAVNMAGAGEKAKTNAFQLNYNDATGGTETIVDDYNGTGQKWMTHTYTTVGTADFTVVDNADTFRILVVGGAGGGGYGTSASQGGPGGTGNAVTDDFVNLDVTQYDAVVGAGGKGEKKANYPASQGGASSLAGITGGGGRTGGSTNDAHNNGAAGVNGSFVDSDIRGSGEERWAGQGYGTGGGWAFGDTGTNGKSGIVIVAYQIGVSTTREIAQAQAEQEARAAGVEQGKQEGYAQAQEDLNDVIEAGRTALQTAVEQDTMIIDGKEQPVKRRRRK